MFYREPLNDEPASLLLKIYLLEHMLNGSWSPVRYALHDIWPSYRTLHNPVPPIILYPPPNFLYFLAYLHFCRIYRVPSTLI